MVMPDLNAVSKESSTFSAQLKYTAKPIDRLAAQIFDISLVMAPIFLLLTAPFKVMLYHGFLVENQEEVILAGMAHACIAIVIFISYHFFANFYFNTTIGKHLFRLQVVDVWSGQSLNAWRSLGRAVVSALSFLTLGFAFLPILSNDRRRSVADLCFDCEVITRRNNRAHAPIRQERLLVRGIFAVTATIALIIAFSLCRSVLNYTATQEDVSAWFMDRASKCEAIDEAMEQWPVSKGEHKANRLRVSLALYAAGLVDRKCLQSEADSEASFSNAPSSLYYLAQSFAHSDETDVSDSYLEQVCSEDSKSSSCELSQIVNAWSVEDWERMEEAFDHMKHPDVVAAVWAIRHYMKQGRPEQAFTWIRRVSPNKALGSFLQVQRVKSLWLMNHTAEAQIGALQSIESLPEEWQIEMASWMCTQETTLECNKGSSLSCGWLNQQKFSAQDDPGLAVAMMRAKECSGEKVDYAEITELNGLSSWPLLVKAIENQKSGHKDDALRVVRKLMHDKELPEDFQMEAYRRFIDLADATTLNDTLAEMKDLPQGMWRELQPRVALEFTHRQEKGGALRLPASEKDEP
jgi:uncharacterized RDD family membrane protein YckC